MARFRFGIFDFDPETRELRRHGSAVRLQAQPSQALSVLLANAGQVVTRETLQREVWGGETFVDFDRGLNFCIAQIRTALGDSAESPRFIKTLPKRGYQFIAPVDVDEPPPAEKAPTPAPAFRVSPVVLSIVAVAVAAGLLVWFQASKPGTKSVAPATVAVMHFDNETGSSAADQLTGGLTDAVVVELADSAGGRYSVIGNAAILRAPRSQRDLIAVGSSLGASYVVLGQVQRDQSRTRVLAHLIRLPEQKHLSVVRMDGRLEESLRFEDELAKKVAAEFGPRITADAARRSASRSVASH